MYAALFGTGYFIYGQVGYGILCGTVAAIAATALFRTLPRVGFA